MIVLITVIAWFILAFVVGAFASGRGRSFFGWWLLSMITSPLIGGVFLLIAGEKEVT